MVYRMSDWVFLFYTYCFLGWCFETTVVSVFVKHHFVNRGFLFGPLLPIYGFGALAILLTTLPFRAHWWAVGLVGMAAATLLEYVTGVVMEALFKVRYWDYSHKRFNFQGHICLTSSLAWGGLSVALVYFMNQPLERLMLNINVQIRQLVVFVMTIFFTIDFTHSVMTAIDLKKLLARVDSLREELHGIQKRIENLETSIQNAKDQRRAQLSQELEGLRDKQRMMLDWIGERFGADKRSLLRRNPTALSKRYKEALEKIHEWQARR